MATKITEGNPRGVRDARRVRSQRLTNLEKTQATHFNLL